jgi:hypothetical protein
MKKALVAVGIVLTVAASAKPAKKIIVAAPARVQQAAPQAIRATEGVTTMSLVEALASVGRPEIIGIFNYVDERSSPMAFADLLVRDTSLLKKFTAKLDDDIKVAGGVSQWDHLVCAVLVNTYASPMAGTNARPDEKRMSKINNCVLTPELSLSDIVAKRKR